MYQSIKRKVRFLKNVPGYDSYTGFAERFVAAKAIEAAEKSFIKTVFDQIDKDLYAAHVRETNSCSARKACRGACI